MARKFIPQAVHPGTYRVHATPTAAPFEAACSAPNAVAGKTSPGVFIVPMGQDPVSASLRAHEMGHLGVFVQIIKPTSISKDLTHDPRYQTAMDTVVNHRWPENVPALPLQVDLGHLANKDLGELLFTYFRVFSLSPADPLRAELLETIRALLPPFVAKQADRLFGKLSELATTEHCDVTRKFLSTLGEVMALIPAVPPRE